MFGARILLLQYFGKLFAGASSGLMASDDALGLGLLTSELCYGALSPDAYQHDLTLSILRAFAACSSKLRICGSMYIGSHSL